MTDLAEELKTSRGRVSQAISRLEEHGWVRRETDENDRRGQLAVLTEQGF